MTADLVVKNCRIVSPDGIISGAGVAVEGEKIVCLAKEPLLPAAERTIDANGNYLIPGAMEPHAHLSYGSTSLYDRQVRSETSAAVVGGVTTFMIMLPGQGLLMPYEDFEKATNGNALIDTVFHMKIGTDQHVRELRRYAELGMTDFKFHMYGHPEWGTRTAEDDIIWRTMEVSSDLIDEGYPCLVQFHCDNQRVVDKMEEKLREEGKHDIGAYFEARPSWTTVEGARRVLYFGEQLPNVPIYLVHMQVGRVVQLVAEAKAKGQRVWLETQPQNLTFTKDDFPLKNTFGTKEDIALLWKGISEGIVDTLGTDHEVAHKKEYAGRDDLWPSPGAATMLPVMLSEGVNKGRISLEALVRLMSLNPARAFSIYPKKGAIAVGSDADLVIVDLDKEQRVEPEKLHSESDLNYYEGWKLRGWPVMTICRGTVVMEEDEVIGKPGYGRVMPRGRTTGMSAITRHEPI
ncbi:MAG TPA: amidohydrolase family protein [Candidatus Bathyarchaeia archaeon]|nr:amidohydrolase family protein [Candidatus Bathyarchaeia archaeon]